MDTKDITALTLFCYVRGDKFRQAFEVEIKENKSVAALRGSDNLKEENETLDRRGIHAYSLVLQREC
jgi:hypothetical protein